MIGKRRGHGDPGVHDRQAETSLWALTRKRLRMTVSQVARDLECRDLGSERQVKGERDGLDGPGKGIRSGGAKRVELTLGRGGMVSWKSPVEERLAHPQAAWSRVGGGASGKRATKPTHLEIPDTRNSVPNFTLLDWLLIATIAAVVSWLIHELTGGRRYNIVDVRPGFRMHDTTDELPLAARVEIKPGIFKIYLGRDLSWEDADTGEPVLDPRFQIELFLAQQRFLKP